jgi:hypothetical protein
MGTPPPDARGEIWFENMRRGDFPSAWRVSDALLKEGRPAPGPEIPRHLQNIWDGTPLAGRRVLVRCYHGLGDTIQFVRYAPLVKEVASTVTLWAQPGLLPLLESVEGIDRLLALHDGTPDVEYDADVEIMELPWVFRTELSTIPRAVPYLHPPPEEVERTESLRVGLVWRAGGWDPRRSLPFEALRPLAGVPDVQLFIVQQEPTAAGWRPGFGVLAERNGLLELARFFRSLDLVISIDGMTAHLAGALGVPVWTLLARDCCWRWMEDRTDSPWYPTMRLFRQQGNGAAGWKPVAERVARELHRLSRAEAQRGRATPFLRR